MSEAPKNVEPAVLATAAPVVDTPAVAESAPAAETVEPTSEVPATTEPTKEEAVAEPVKEVVPVESGVLGYKGPGLLKSMFFSDKFFYFGSEPVDAKSLHSYLRGEKATANENAAWSAETGKGLLYYSKNEAHKATPAGLFNLSEISDIVEEGTVEFAFTSDSHKHTFKASSLAERDNWVSQLKLKVTEAETLKPSVVESEKYKEALASFAKPAPVVAAVVPKKSSEKAVEKEEKKEEVAEAKEEAKEIKEEKKEEKKDRTKSRSASRKRNSIFGSFMKPKEEKKEEKVETKEETAVVEPTVEEPVVAAAVPETTEATPAVEETPVPTTEARPTPVSKRNSIFGTFKNSFNKKTEAAPAVPAKDAEPVSETAPVIPAVEESAPLATEVASPATVPTETTEIPAATNGEVKAETPVVKSDKRKSSLPWLSKKEKPATSDEEAVEKPKSPFAKLRDTVKGKKSPKAPAAEKPAESSAVVEEAKAEETPAVVEPAVVSEPEPVIKDTPAAVTASA